MASRSVGLLLAKCVPCPKPTASKFCVTSLEFDSNLNMYFKKLSYVFAHDPDKICKTGDTVLIEELPEKMSKLVTHRVKEVVFPLGDVVDPLTGKKVIAGKFRDHLDKIDDVYGKTKKRFNYDTAPSRGWQEGKRDFTDKETYIKYQETGEDQPYAV